MGLARVARELWAWNAVHIVLIKNYITHVVLSRAIFFSAKKNVREATVA
jgi:hypothetical protein